MTLCRRHAISPVFCGHYRDPGISIRKRHDSACKLFLSVGNSWGSGYQFTRPISTAIILWYWWGRWIDSGYHRNPLTCTTNRSLARSTGRFSSKKHDIVASQTGLLRRCLVVGQPGADNTLRARESLTRESPVPGSTSKLVRNVALESPPMQLHWHADKR